MTNYFLLNIFSQIFPQGSHGRLVSPTAAPGTDGRGRLIHNNDRHFGNLAFFWQPGAENPQLQLAPVYDMLPMALAPAANGMLPQSSPEPPSPTAALLPVWDQALQLAEQFHSRVSEDDRISDGFKSLMAAD